MAALHAELDQCGLLRSDTAIKGFHQQNLKEPGLTTDNSRVVIHLVNTFPNFKPHLMKYWFSSCPF